MAREVACPACGTRLSIREDAPALTCPRCLGVLAGPPSAGPSGPSADRDVGLDARTTTGCLGVLTALCVLGIVLTYTAYVGRRDIGAEVWMMVLFGVLDVLVFALTLPPVLRKTGVHVLGAIFLALGLLVAVIVFFFAVCAVMVLSGL